MADGQRGRGRRRRGGRGRGGRGREQAVAQAFTPAAAKGIIPDLPAQPGIEEQKKRRRPAETAGRAAGHHRPRTSSRRLRQLRRVRPKASSCSPSGCPGPARVPGSSATMWRRFPATWCARCLFDDVREQRFQDLVFSNLRSMLKARLIAKRPMNYVDATNLTPQERQHWIKLAKDYDYEVQAVFFDVPLEVCLERHPAPGSGRSRRRHAPHGRQAEAAVVRGRLLPRSRWCG